MTMPTELRRIDELIAVLTKSRNTIQEMAREIVALRQELDDKGDKLADLEGRHRRLRDMLRKSDNDLAAARAERDTARSKVTYK